MVSYKKLYLESQKTVLQKIPYYCPECNSQLQMTLSEIFCTNEKCTFDKTMGDLLPNIMNSFGSDFYNPNWEGK